ncbi:polyadenylate-binding protein 8 [Eutrema salsugineum]|uniref:polyadenylate-binding protein 8 n=1 Tax=Eutrema salsugineum TaxID=72664 RepID=UPI000CED74B2|nr:polyadenylate-binding protein 8 [Eutrema salsugineum]
MTWWWFMEEQSIYEMAEAGRTLLYVGDLEPTVTDSVLFDAFQKESRVSSVRVCRDPITRRSLGYGYVTLDYPHDDPYVSQNLEGSIDHRGLYETFCMFGSILRFKVATNASAQSKGSALVQYDNEESALKAIDYMKGVLLNEEEVYVEPFLQRDYPCEKVMFTDVYVKNLSKSLTDEELNTVFREFGPTTSCVIIREGEVPQGMSKGYGFVNFENPEDAERAVEGLNGKKFGDKEWFVTKSKKTYQRESELKRGLKKAINRAHGLNNLCVTKLPKSVTDEILKDFFSLYGTVTSCKVMRDSSGVSKGSGFVEFSKPEEASKAMEEINRELNIRKQAYEDLATSLANATPEQQRTMLGEKLYPIVEQLEPDSAEKITGTLLEMGQTKVIHLLESVAALESKVTEAMEILRIVAEPKSGFG